MSADFIARIVGMIALSVGGVYLGTVLANFAGDEPVLWAVVFGNAVSDHTSNERHPQQAFNNFFKDNGSRIVRVDHWVGCRGADCLPPFTIA